MRWFHDNFQRDSNLEQMLKPRRTSSKSELKK